MISHSIGIDFGTTKTLVCHINPQTRAPEVIKLGRDTAYIPTTAYVDETGQLSFGDDADDRLMEISGCYLRGFKMSLGSSTPLHMYLVDGQPKMLTAKDLVKEYLRYIRTQVETEVFCGEPIAKVTITRPVKFSPMQCEELQQAAIEAGFEQIEFTTEPESAGLAFCALNSAHAFKRSALIVDWGGGTLDIALVTRQANKISTHRTLTDGDTSMGGERFDERLWDNTTEKLYNLGVSRLSPTAHLPRLRRAKEQLSIKNNATLSLSYEGGLYPPLNISRTEFNKLIENDVAIAVKKVQDLIARIPADLVPEMLLLVGGSSRIPLIKEKLEEACHLPAHIWHYSREAVAIGAALWGTEIQINDSDGEQESAEPTPSIDTEATLQPQSLQAASPVPPHAPCHQNEEEDITYNQEQYTDESDDDGDNEPPTLDSGTIAPATQTSHGAPVSTPKPPVPKPAQPSQKKRSKYIAAILAFFLGCFGAHHFYHGHWVRGIIYAAVSIFGATIGLFLLTWIIAFVEMILYLCMSKEKYDTLYNRSRK